MIPRLLPSLSFFFIHKLGIGKPIRRVLFLCGAICLVGLSIPHDKTSADLAVGDAYLVGWHADTQESMSIVIFDEMDIGDQLFFTDSGFFANGDLRGVETFMTWTATSAMAAGTVVTFMTPDVDPDAIADEGTAVGKLDLRINGDQIFIGNSAFPMTNPGTYDHNDLIFGFDYDTVAGWDTTSVGPRTSALPSVLNNHNVAFDHVDNGVYTGPRSGLTVAQFQAAIQDSSNWNLSNVHAEVPIDSTDFQISSVPEPSAVMLLGALGLFLVRKRRKR